MKKFQVFISSTYTDMIEERQGAVEAILEAGHIPAGMELFAADNKKQFDVIKKWIRDCDVFILILGGRYGSCEKGSKKSYIQMEYEYAKRIGKKPIAILLSEEGIRRKIGSGSLKVEDFDYIKPEYNTFKNNIKESKMCDFFDDVASLKNCILRILQNCEKDSKLTGWIRAHDSEVDYHYPYEVLFQDFTFTYLDLNNIEYTKHLRLRMTVDGIRYYTDRYAWNAGGKIEKELMSKNQSIVDEFSDGAFSAYTIRFDNALKRGDIVDIIVKHTITDAVYIEHQYIGLTNSLPVKDLRLTVNVPDELHLSECRYNIFTHSVDQVASVSRKISPSNNRITKYFKGLEIGKRYNIEWTVHKK